MQLEHLWQTLIDAEKKFRKQSSKRKSWETCREEVREYAKKRERELSKNKKA